MFSMSSMSRQNAILIQDVELKKLNQRCAQALIEEIERIGAEQDFVVGGWPGGTSAKGVFDPFVDLFAKLPENIQRKHHIFQVDERLYQEHNQDMLEQELVTPLLNNTCMQPEQIHMYPLSLRDEVDHGTSTYFRLLKKYGGRFDYIVLGTGYPHVRNDSGAIIQHDCHVAGAFAHHPSTESLEGKQPGFVFYEDSPKPPPGRITATLELLALSDVAFLIILGEKKDAVLREYLHPNTSASDCPAAIVRRCARRVIVSDRPVSSDEMSAL